MEFLKIPEGKGQEVYIDPERIKPFLEGYFSEIPKYDHFDEIFQLMRLRYNISKMALRIKRYTYEQTPFLKSMIEKGEKHLEELSEIFSLSDSEWKPKEIVRCKNY